MAPCLLVLLDLSATFKSVDQAFLIDRRENYVGIGGQALAWFNCCLSNHYHFVYVNGEMSHKSRVKSECHRDQI